MEIRRFGIGHRRADGPAGTHGVAGQVIHGDARGVVSELAFGRHALMEPHLNPNTTWFIVIEGGGFVQVADERARVAAGEAILFPANVMHGAWTDVSEMRAIVVEFGGDDDSILRGLIEGGARALPATSGRSRPVARGEGSLAPRKIPPRGDPESGEPV
ncbi:MAG TPA: cupin domain-containing protein [Candidatus Limnocylindrales bacterium]